jgi:two-component system chemotaxis response regulator CheY
MKSCLIVDDSKVVRIMARRIVEDLNFLVEEAEDGKVALDCCMNQTPDIILLDWNMPVMNGIEFLRALRSLAGGDQPIVVFYTTENSMKNIHEAISAGANEYIMKPFDSDVVQSKFEQVGIV